MSHSHGRGSKELDAEYRAKKVAEIEQEILKQKKRLSDAERKLKAVYEEALYGVTEDRTPAHSWPFATESPRLRP